MITKTTTAAKGRIIYHYGDIALDAAGWADKLGIKRNAFLYWVLTYGLKNAVEGRKERVKPKAGIADPDFQNKQLINSLQGLGFKGKELEVEFLKRAIQLTY
jgi:hypothetical protein